MKRLFVILGDAKDLSAVRNGRFLRFAQDDN